jgi:hypothetical protein
MTVIDQRPHTGTELLSEGSEAGREPTGAGTAYPESFRGTDPGEGETWEIFRLRCPECDRPIALLGDEERFPQHAVVRTAWNPFTPAVCPGSGQLVDEAAEPEDDAEDDAEPALEALLALPPELDWRTQPFSHVGGPGSRPMQAQVPQMRAPLDLRPTVKRR